MYFIFQCFSRFLCVLWSLRLHVMQKALELLFQFFSSLSLSRRCFFDKGLSLTFHDLLPKKLITKIGLTVLDKLKKVCATDVFEDVIWNLFDPCHAMCITLCTVISIHIRKITKLEIWETRRKMTEKVQLFKVQKTEKSI